MEPVRTAKEIREHLVSSYILEQVNKLKVADMKYVKAFAKQKAEKDMKKMIKEVRGE